MTDNTKEYKKSPITMTGFTALTTPQEIYDYAEYRYGPGFAQECVDSLTRNQESSQKSPPDNNMSSLLRLTSQLHTLSQVCKADFFQTWGAEDKRFYMNLLTTVSNDVSVALQGSLNEISATDETSNSL